ncbi:hypothetical protein HanIR_Chr00c11g0907911 [Helianthus annuus]|nr:hypothetical protein HanIR_Chr00c11g0907911 [Helianthus annuus]
MVSGHRRRRPYGPSPTVSVINRRPKLSVSSELSRRHQVKNMDRRRRGIRPSPTALQCCCAIVVCFGSNDESKRVVEDYSGVTL